MSVTFSAAARDDLLRIFDYLSDRAPDVAERIVDELEARAPSLAVHPLRGAVLPGSARGWRRLVAAPFVIVYSVQGERVTIRRVQHGARDLDALIRSTGAT